MSITLSVTKDLTAAIADALKAEVAKAVDLSAHAIGVEAIAMIETGPKTGQIYLTGPPTVPHQASAPGESPANWTGALVDSIDAEMIGPTEAEVRAGGGDVDYAKDLELGSPSGKIAPRPFLTPAAEAGKKFFIENTIEAVKKACSL